VTQFQWATLMLKIVLSLGFVSLIQWIVVYTRLEKWWKHQLGWTLVAKTGIIAALFVPTTLSLYMHLTRADSYLIAWIDIVLIGSVTPVMIWRTVIWANAARDGRRLQQLNAELEEAHKHALTKEDNQEI
jgi:hypothetical protein